MFHLDSIFFCVLLSALLVLGLVFLTYIYTYYIHMNAWLDHVQAVGRIRNALQCPNGEDDVAQDDYKTLKHFQSFRSSNSLRDRSALLGGPTPPASGRSSPFEPPSHAPLGYRYADDLEGQNDEQLEGLSAKVKLLKDITIGIGNEVRGSTAQLSQMNDAFVETSGILAGTFRRMNNMAERQGCRWLWYIIFLAVVFWFFIVVWWFRR